MYRILRDYPAWTALFDAPRNVSAMLMLLCRTATEVEMAYQESDHSKFFVQLFVNPIGAAMMNQQGKRTFPEGTVIVKQKWAQNDQFQLDPAQKLPAGLGIMVKRAPGFDTPGGDWQYYYVDAAGAVTSDSSQLGTCRACHMQQRNTDAVFYPAVIAE